MSIASKYPSIKPSLNLDFANTKTLDPRVTFSRASTATYYDGKTVAKAEENLLLNSATLSTQTRSVRAVEHTLSFTGTGTITLSGASTAGPLVGTGEDNRVVLTFTPSAGNLTLTVTGTVTKAQLEARSSATAWIETTTQPITNYVPVLQTAAANVARFDHNPVTGESLGLLIEEQRTNLVLNSESYTFSFNSSSRAVLTANAGVAPDGNLTAELIENYSGNQSVFNFRSLTVTAGTTYTDSMFVKFLDAPTGFFIIYFGGGASIGGVSRTLTLTSGVITSSDSDTVVTHVGNGWYRIACTYAPSVTSITETFSVSSGMRFLIWGRQIEAGAFPTSYIPTTTSQVTRSADSASMTGSNFSSWYSADQGTAYVSVASSQGNAPRAFTLIAGTAVAEQIAVARDITRVRSNSSDIGSFFTNTVLGSNMAVAWAFNQQAAARNGVVQSSTNAGRPSGITNLNIGTQGLSGGYLNGHIRKIAYYPLRLTNTQLQALTK